MDRLDLKVSWIYNDIGLPKLNTVTTYDLVKFKCHLLQYEKKASVYIAEYFDRIFKFSLWWTYVPIRAINLEFILIQIDHPLSTV